MFRRTVAIITLAAFLVFTWSCFHETGLSKSPEDVRKLRAGQPTIYGVVLTSGLEVRFPHPSDIRFTGDFLLASKERPTPYYFDLVIPKEEVKSTDRDADGNVHFILTRDGKAYDVRSSKESDTQWTIEGKAYDLVVPFSDVEIIRIERLDPVMTSVMVLGAAIAVGVLIAALTYQPPPPPPTTSQHSCPFIYSYDGAEYIFDAEPYGGAIAEGVKRTEWCGLPYLKEVGGEYKIMIANEGDETEYTDELKLLVVDHPAGVGAVADEQGRVHTLTHPCPPVKAADGRGRDILPLVGRTDGSFWITKAEEKNPDRKEDLRDELLFEFSKPAGARTAKLVFNGCSTLWASQMIKRFLELYGTNVEKRYEALRVPGPAQAWRDSFNEREELYRLRLQVDTPAGWVTKGLIVGGGPFVSKDRVYLLDLADVPGDVLKIKLCPPAEFWMINSLAVDYDADLPVQVHELEATRAVDDAGHDIRPALTSADGRYFAMPLKGDRAELTFRAPAHAPGMERSVILKANGYYDIHLRAEGPPQNDTLLRFALEPGFVVQYSFREFLKWRAETYQALRKLN